MNALLEKQFNQLDAERKNLFNELKQYPDDVINKKPSPQAWSVAEVIHHLITAEEMSLKYLMKKTQDTSTAKPETLKSKFRWLLVQVVFTFNIKFEAPEIVIPKSDFQKLTDLDAEWSAIREQTRGILDKLSDKEVNTELWKHALAGKMNLYHMVDFFGVHFRRHRKQIDRTLEAVK